MRSKIAVAIVFVAAGAALAPHPARADNVTSTQFVELSERAKTDPRALEELIEVTSVDGRPVDMQKALDATGSELGSRLDALPNDARPASGSADTARTDAADILSERRFQPSELPRPFAGVLRRLGDVIDRWFRRLVDVLPGGEATFWVIFCGIIVAIAAFIAARLSRRRRPNVTAGTHITPGESERAEDARELLAEADRAEAAGDGRRAVRLRFRAGLLRLGSLGAIAFRPSITTGEVRRKVRSRSFDAVARSFEEIAYGGRPATTDDLELSRAGWDDVLKKDAA